MATVPLAGSLRRRIVLGLLSCLLALFLGALIFRSRTPHKAPAAAVASEASTSPSGSSSGSALTSASAPSGSASAGPARPTLSLSRPVRVVAAGWDTAAAAILANEGLEPGKDSAFAALGVDTRINPQTADKGVESALARGGEDKDGADIGILPLADFVASYERLSALHPQVFFVTGWSRGREGFWAQRDSLTNLPTKGVSLSTGKTSAASFVGLFLLEIAGVAPGSVTLAAPESKTPAFFAGDRNDEAQAGTAKLLLTTADAPRLVPIVAVAQASMLEKHSDVLAAWVRGWLQGQTRLQSDAAEAARKMSSLPGAPEPLILVRRLGEIEPALLHDNARAVGLSGRSPVLLDQLFQRVWQMWRATRVLTTPPPETTPCSPAIISRLVRANPELVLPEIALKALPREGTSVLLTYRLPKGKLDDSALAAEVGFVAGVFERSVLRIAVLGAGALDEARTRKLIQTTSERFDKVNGRLIPAKGSQGEKGTVIVEILSVP